MHLSLSHIAKALGGEVSNGQVRAPGPRHSAKDRSLCVKLNEAGDDIVVKSWANDDAIACKDYVRQKIGLPAWQPKKGRNGNGRSIDDEIDTALSGTSAKISVLPRATTVLGPAATASHRKLVANYDYTDIHGKLIYQARRWDPKNFTQRRPDGRGGWITQKVFEGISRVPFRWPELAQDMAAFPDAPIFVTEGEKDCENVRKLNLTATTCAGSVWTDEIAALFKGRDIIILEDNDKSGREKSTKAAQALAGHAASIRVASFADLPEKGDVSDWIALDPQKHNADALAARCLDAPLWKPETAKAVVESNIPRLNEWDAGDDTDLPPPRQWLLANQFCRKFLSGLLAPGGTGKTALRTLQGLSLATGRDLCGQHVFKRCRVLMVSLEDDQDELKRRIAAARIHHGIDATELKGWLFCAAPKGFKLAEINAKGAREIGILEKMLRKTIELRKPGLVMLDPFIKLHALEENDNGAMDFVCDLLVQLAIQYDIAVDAPHHTKKGQLTAGDADSGRGASAARDAGRLIYTLTRMSEDEANAFGVKPEDRPLYVRLDSGKVNTAPPSRKAMWFKLVGVPLGNGNDDYPSGDEVQTLVRWQPPETWAGLSSAVLNTALTDIEAGMPNGQRYSDAARTSTRAAWQVVQRHCPDRTEAQCREIIKTWVKNGVLYHEDYDDPVDRKERKGLRLDPSKRPS
jgi:5S rRNA maturation endonuclease (ribonuclease M5)